MVDLVQPEIALILSTYQRPGHLERSLLSIAVQQGVEDRMELVVTDDGSQDQTADTVRAFAASVSFPVRFTTHAHDGFRLAVCRNDGVLASTAPYLLFLDGDCVFPRDHVAMHLRHRQTGCVVAGDCYRLDQITSRRITEQAIRSDAYRNWIPGRERKRIKRKAWRARIYQMLRMRMRPRLTGNNIGIWRQDLERVNGFDENFVGWGFEDVDLQRRLGMAGLNFKTILPWTAAIHLWHPTDTTAARNGQETANLAYYNRPQIAMRCRHGLAQRITASG